MRPKTSKDTQEQIRKAKAEARKKQAEALRKKFNMVLNAERLPLPEPEYQFHPTRKWRFDYAWKDLKIALEVEGGVYLAGGGRHTRPKGYISDCDKYSEAAILGWIVLRVIPSHLCRKGPDLLRRAIELRNQLN